MSYRLICIVLVLALTACGSSRQRIDPNKRYVRYFHPSKETAYTLSPPIGNWTYYAPRYERTGAIFFDGQLNPYVGVEVSFDLYERFLKFNDGPVMDRNKQFFRTGMFRENANPMHVKTEQLGTQGHRCVRNLTDFDGVHAGPSRDPAISGKWAGKGNTRYVFQTTCPFHIGERYIDLVMQKTYFIADTSDADLVKIDPVAIDAEIERRIKPVWESLIVSPKLSQEPMPE